MEEWMEVWWLLF